MKSEERLLLIDSLIDGSISEADLLRIEAELTVDPEVRREYYRRLQLDVLLRREASSPAATVGDSVVLTTRRSSWSKWVVGSLVAIAASVMLMVMVNQSGDKTRPVVGRSAGSSPEPWARGFAVLQGHDAAVWDGDWIDQGDLLPAGVLHLRSGRVHLEFFSGVQMVLEGDSLFSIDSPMQVTMMHGRARARVPEPAQGFRIKTSSGDVVDLGTEFSVDVDAEGADVHVVDGEVELQPPGSNSVRIDAGRSRHLAPLGTVTDVAAPDREIVGPHEFEDHLQRKQDERFSRWREATAKVRADSRVVAHYHFHETELRSRQVKNRAQAADQSASGGTIVAAAPTSDRWGHSKAALDFSRVGSRVRVNVPGKHRGLTMICWVKINSLDRWYNSLFLTDGHEAREPHWQWMDDGRVFFSVKVPGERKDERSEFSQPVFYSPQIWDASLSGRWVMLAVAYDVDQQRVTHYLNGEPVSRESIPDHALVESIQVGAASICNWSEPMYRTDPAFVLRNLNGSMDEFAIYSGALSDDEILQWYRLGNPNEL